MSKSINVVINTEEERDALVKQLSELTFKKELLKTWQEYLQTIKYIHELNGIEMQAVFLEESIGNNSLIARYKLEKLRDYYNDGWKANWKDGEQGKYCIIRVEDGLNRLSVNSYYNFLHFKDRDIRDLFLENFKDLIEQYFEIPNKYDCEVFWVQNK